MTGSIDGPESGGVPTAATAPSGGHRTGPQRKSDLSSRESHRDAPDPHDLRNFIAAMPEGDDSDGLARAFQAAVLGGHTDNIYLPPATCWCWHHRLHGDPEPQMPGLDEPWGLLAALANPGAFFPITTLTPTELIVTVEAAPAFYSDALSFRQRHVSLAARSIFAAIPPSFHSWQYHPKFGDHVEAIVAAETPLAAAEAAIEATNQHWIHAAANATSPLPKPRLLAHSPNASLQAGALYAVTHHLEET